MTEINVTLGEPEPTSGGPDSIEWTASSTTVVVDRDLLARIEAHTAEDVSLECGGVLLGRIDEAGGLVAVLEAIRADGATRKADSLKFTHEVIADIHAKRDRDFPALHIVGWYHSHPGYGIFLSADDLFMHRNFFAAAYQVAYVVDPIRDDRGMFVWLDGEVLQTDAWGPFTARGAPGDTVRARAAEAAAAIAATATRRPAGPPTGERPAQLPEREVEPPSAAPGAATPSAPTTVVVNQGVRRSGVGDVAPRMLAAVAAALAVVFFGLGFGVAKGTSGDGGSQLADSSAPGGVETTVGSSASSRTTVPPATTTASPSTAAPATTAAPASEAKPPTTPTSNSDVGATTLLNNIADDDVPKVANLVGSWVVQLRPDPPQASPPSPRSALDRFMALRDAHPDVLLVRMSEYDVGGTSEWATIVNKQFETEELARKWCTKSDFGTNECGPLELEAAPVPPTEVTTR